MEGIFFNRRDRFPFLLYPFIDHMTILRRDPCNYKRSVNIVTSFFYLVRVTKNTAPFLLDKQSVSTHYLTSLLYKSLTKEFALFLFTKSCFEFISLLIFIYDISTLVQFFNNEYFMRQRFRIDLTCQ